MHGNDKYTYSTSIDMDALACNNENILMKCKPFPKCASANEQPKKSNGSDNQANLIMDSSLSLEQSQDLLRYPRNTMPCVCDVEQDAIMHAV